MWINLISKLTLSVILSEAKNLICFTQGIFMRSFTAFRMTNTDFEMTSK